MMGQASRVRVLTGAASLLLGLSLLFLLAGLLHLHTVSRDGIVPDLDLNVLSVRKGSPAESSGIAAGDRIVAVGGDHLPTLIHYALRTMTSPPGREVVYTVERNGTLSGHRLVPAAIPVGKRALLAVPLFLIPIAVAAFIYFRRPANPATFLFYVFGVCFPPFTLAGFDVAEFTINPPLFSLWAAFLFVMFSSGIHFVLIFPEKRGVLHRHPWILWVSYGVSGALLALNLVFYNRLMSAPTREGVVLMLRIGLADMAYAFGVSTAIIAGFLHTYLTSPLVTARKQVKLLLAGAAASTAVEAVGVGLTFESFYDFLLSDATFPFFSPIIFTIATGIAVQRYRIMEVNRLINKSIEYFLLSGTALGAFLLLASSLGWVLDHIIGRATTLSFAFSALVVAMGFAPISAALQRALNRWFYREKFAFHSFLAEISGDLLSAIDFRNFRGLVESRCRDLLHITRVEVLLRGPEGLVPPDDAGKVAGGESPGPVAIPPPVMTVLDRGEALLRDRLLENPDDPFSRDGLHSLERLGAEALVPLLWRGTAVGALLLGPKASETPYDSDDLGLLQALANQVAIAREVSRLIHEEKIKVRMAQELATATSIQKNLLPKGDPEVPGLELASAFHPALEVSGDYYGFFPYAASRSAHMGLAIADVMGKGVPAALLASMIRSAIEVQVAKNDPILAVMESLNQLVHRNGTGMLITFVYAVWDWTQRTLTYSIAGHNFPYLYRNTSGTLSFLEQEAFPLGVEPGTSYHEAQVILEPGDLLLFYTDGIVEALNSDGKMYGYERFESVIRNHAHEPPAVIREVIVNEVMAHCGDRPLSDDVTLIVVRVKAVSQ